MKILRATIRKNRTTKGCHFSYPKVWDAQRIDVLAYEDYPENIGKVWEDCVCITDDEMSEILLKDSQVKEIEASEINEFVNKWKPSTTLVTDTNLVARAIKKILSSTPALVALRKCLSEKEIDGLDENKAVPGLERKPEFDIQNLLDMKRKIRRKMVTKNKHRLEDFNAKTN